VQIFYPAELCGAGAALQSSHGAKLKLSEAKLSIQRSSRMDIGVLLLSRQSHRQSRHASKVLKFISIHAKSSEIFKIGRDEAMKNLFSARLKRKFVLSREEFC